jgi:RHS repeat-associated protein
MILYTGRERDSETGLQLNRHRFYAAHLGRWITRDPSDYQGSPYNLYEYSASDPCEFNDPSGLFWHGRCDYAQSGQQCAHPDPAPGGGYGGPGTGNYSPLPPSDCQAEGFWIDCMACCIDGGAARRAAIGTIGFRYPKTIKWTEVSTTSVWSTYIRRIGTACGRTLNVSRQFARTVVSRVVVVVTIGEGTVDIGKELRCSNECAGLPR